VTSEDIMQWQGACLFAQLHWQEGTIVELSSARMITISWYTAAAALNNESH